MTLLSAVSDSSPLIALADIGLLVNCGVLFASCVVPPEVDREIAPTVRRPAWVAVRPLATPIDRRIVLANLDPGETHALGLALEIGGVHVLVDERRARRLAAALGLPVIGTVGLLVVAKRQGVIPAIRPSLDALLATGFFVSAEIIQRALQDAGE